MIKIECSLKTREDLRQLTPLEIKIADCLMECYYENDAFSHITHPKRQESLPTFLYLNVVRCLTKMLIGDPLPRQLLLEYYEALSPAYIALGKNIQQHFDNWIGKNLDITVSQYNYIVNFEHERVLIWGGLYLLISANQTLSHTQKNSIQTAMYNYVKESTHRDSCFDPFLRIDLDGMPQEEPVKPKVAEKALTCEPITNEPVTDGPQNNETISEEPFTNESASEEPSKEITLPDYIKLDNLLEKALLHYSKYEAYIQWLKALLTLTVNEQSGGDPNINNLLKAKLKLFSQKVKQKQEVEKKKHSVPIFLHLILHPEPKKLLKRLHQLIDEKSGAEVGAVLMRAQQKGYLSKVPTQAEFRSEFALVGKWNAIHNYMNDNNEKALAKANKIIIFEGE